MWIETYRPKHVDEIAGHEKLKTVIRKYINVGDIPHFLFYGINGTGKTLLAKLIGHELLGEDAFDTNFISINASDDRSVGKVRDLVLNAIRHSTMNGYIRIILLDEVDGMLTDAQEVLRGAMNRSNSTRFILACNDISKIIGPLADRCMCFEFKPLKKDDILKRLTYIMKREQLNIEIWELEQIAKECGGSMRKAITELEKLSMIGNEEEVALKRYLKK